MSCKQNLGNLLEILLHQIVFYQVGYPLFGVVVELQHKPLNCELVALLELDVFQLVEERILTLVLVLWLLIFRVVVVVLQVHSVLGDVGLRQVNSFLGQCREPCAFRLDLL